MQNSKGWETKEENKESSRNRPKKPSKPVKKGEGTTQPVTHGSRIPKKTSKQRQGKGSKTKKKIGEE